jgi:hypothetical protein
MKLFKRRKTYYLYSSSTLTYECVCPSKNDCTDLTPEEYDCLTPIGGNNGRVKN